MHQRKSEYEPLLGEMLTVYIESSLASPLSGNVAIEINPRSTVRDVINNFLISLQRDSSLPGLAVFDKHFNKLDWNASIDSQGIAEGSKLYIGYDKSRIFRPFHLAVVGAATLLIAVFIFIVSCVLFGGTGGSIPIEYGVVIDAGSTHTEVFLYYWLGNKDNGTGVIKQKDSCEWEMGIADRIDPENILLCISNLTSQIPKGLPSPRLYLGATGGMRLLNLSDPKDASLILMTLKYALRSESVQVETVDIIKGEDEALFSWISTNFLNQSLNKGQSLDTFGALDLGGASTQYAYAGKSGGKNLSTVRNLQLFGHEYSVASESFLCFGYYEAMDRLEAIAVMESGSDKLADPCLPIGFTRVLNTIELSEKPCVGNKNFIMWLRNNTDITQITVNGTSNYRQCKKNVEFILDEVKCNYLGYDHCLNAPKLGPLNRKFMAFSGFYYVAHFFNSSRSLDEFVSATENWCSLTWEKIQQITPKSQLHHVSRYCFAGIYIIELLTSKYGFNSSTWKNIDFRNQVAGADVGWTLGFMINATNDIPDKTPSPPVISLETFVLLLSVSIIMAVLAILVLRNHIKRYYHHKFERLLHI